MASKGFEGGSHVEGWKLDPSKVREGVNLRHDLGDVESLAQSIAANGQDVPGLVRRDSEGYAVLVAGYRRLAAIRLINADPARFNVELTKDKDGNPQPFPFRAVFKPFSDEGALAANLRENVERRELSPVDLAHASVRLESFGWDRAKIAAAMGVSAGRVAQYRSLLDLPDETIRAVHAGELTEAGARAMLGAPVDLVREATAAVRGGEVKAREAVARVVAQKRAAGKKVGRTLAEVKKALEALDAAPAYLLLDWINGNPQVTFDDVAAIFAPTEPAVATG